MTIKTLAQKGVPKRQIARQLMLSEGSVRYHLKRIASNKPDGRALQQRRASQVADAIAHWHDIMGATSNTAELYKWLVAEHDYAGSLRSVQRFSPRCTRFSWTSLRMDMCQTNATQSG